MFFIVNATVNETTKAFSTNSWFVEKFEKLTITNTWIDDKLCHHIGIDDGEAFITAKSISVDVSASVWNISYRTHDGIKGYLTVCDSEHY